MKGWITGWGRASLAAAVAVSAVVSGCAALPVRVRPAEAFRPDEGRVLAKVPAGPTAVEPAFTAEAMAVTNLPPPPKGRYLESGDRVRVTLRHRELEGPYEQVIDDEGRINLPYIGPIKVAGMIVSEAQKLAEDLYIKGEIYKQITVIIVPPESEYTVYGEVIRPGAFPLGRGLTLLQALARAGRFTEFADPARAQIRRGIETIKVNIPRIREGKDPDPDVQPGDVIYIPPGWR
jgi:protein involved in polysaccharide export with SLBB domain